MFLSIKPTFKNHAHALDMRQVWFWTRYQSLRNNSTFRQTSPCHRIRSHNNLQSLDIFFCYHTDNKHNTYYNLHTIMKFAIASLFVGSAAAWSSLNMKAGT